MNSPIKTIIKNKSNKCFFCNMYPRYQIALKPCGETGDTVELCGDIFTMMRTRQEVQGLMKSLINGTIDITFGVDEIFKTSKLAYNSTLKIAELANKVVEPVTTAENKDTTATQEDINEQNRAPENESQKDVQPAVSAQPDTTNNTAGDSTTTSIDSEPAAKPNNRRRSKNVKIG